MFAIGHLVVWTLVPTLANPNAPLDCVEMLYWGYEWQWGYFKHPPLPAWCCEAMRMMFGNADWPLYLSAQLCIVTCFWAAWKMARQSLSPWQAVASAVILESCYYFSFTSPEMNNNVLAKALWALAILSLYYAVQTSRKRYWVATGFVLALSVLTKYDAGLLILSMLVFSVATKRGRECWKTTGPYLLTVTSLLCVTPHLMWLVENDFSTLRYLSQRSASDATLVDHFVYPLSFAASQIFGLALILILAIGVLGRRWRFKSYDNVNAFHRQYLVFVVLGPPLLAMLYSLLTGAKLRSMWGAAMWTYFGVLLFVLFQAKAELADYRRLIRRSAFCGFALAMLYALNSTLLPAVKQSPSRVHFPGRELAAAVQQRWQSKTDAPLQIAGGDWWLAGNVAFYGDQETSVYAEMSEIWAPWMSKEQLRAKGGVILWDAGRDGAEAERIEKLTEYWLSDYSDVVQQPDIELAWQRIPDAAPIRIGIAIIPPAADSRISVAKESGGRKTR